MSDIPTVPPPEATPTYSGFLSWVRNVMGVPTQALADDSPTLTWALNVATLVVNKGLIVTGMYALACYNLGGDNLVNFAQDVGSPPFNYPGTKTPYWAYLRRKFNTLGFVSGVVSASSDESTSQTLATPEQYTGYTLANLQQTKTPWGRAYLGIAADWGPVWGLS
jgi:hypothetical protein